MNDKEIEKYSSTCDIARGVIITTGYKIEFGLSIYLTEYFSRENVKSDFFRYFLSDTTPFETKKYIFASLRKQKKLNIKDDYKKLIDDIQYVQNVRNLMAHSDIVINEQTLNNFKDNKLTFKNFSHKKWERNVLVNIKDITFENRDSLIYSLSVFIETSNRIRHCINISS